MKCPRCQHDNAVDMNFCGECGARLTAGCSACGASNPPTSNFCGECGEPLARSAPAARFTSPETYTPAHLAEKILTSRSALEGERKQITVLFADMKGSMELLADRDPEEARKLLDPVLELMMEAVHRYEGTVNQVMGDGIMALFGAPLAHEDHAARACYAALRMQALVGRYAEELRQRRGIDVQIRVGLNSGDVVVRYIGSDLRMDYTAVGQTTHVAARVEQLARPGTTLMAKETLRLAEGYVLVKPLGAVTIKGLAEPVEVFELVAGGSARRRFEVIAARGLTRFVGRRSELDVLAKALERARPGHGQVVALVGEPGAGKSRLFWEFTHSQQTHGCLVLESGSVSYGKATPYLPVINLLKAYVQIEDRDEVGTVREKVTNKLLTLDRALEPSLPVLLALLDVPVDDPSWQALDPPERRQRTLDTVNRLLLRESQEQPLVVVIEDLHWIDSETQTLLDSLVEGLPVARILLLVNHRPEYEHRWTGKPHYADLRLDPLPRHTAEELLDALLGEDARLWPLKQVLIEQTEGNPFFLEETVRTLVETKVLAGQRGTYHLEKPLDRIQVPASVHAVLAARIDRLPPEEKRFLQAASVVGKDVPGDLLLAIADMPEPEVRNTLAHLQAAEFLYEARFLPDPVYTFKHALTHEVAYSSLLQARRRALHGVLVEVIERLYADRLSERVELLAHHASCAERWDTAVMYLRRAGAKAAARPAYREAVQWYEQALRALSRLPDTRPTLEASIDVRVELGTALVFLAEFGRFIDHLHEAETLARSLGDRRRLALIASHIAHCHYLDASQYERTVEWGREALGHADDLGDVGLGVIANLYLGYAWLGLGNYRHAAHAMRRNVERLTGDLEGERWGLAVLPASVSREVLARCLADLGGFEEAVSLGRDAVTIAEAHHPGSVVQASYGLGYVYLRRGAVGDAITTLERGLDLGRRWSSSLFVPFLASALGAAYALTGRLGEALPLLEEGSASERIARSLRVARLAEGYLLAGRTADARAAADEARALSRTYKERGYEGWILHLLGQIASRREALEVEAAEANYRQAIVIAGELGMRPLLARCRLGLGRLSRLMNERQAEEHLATAAKMFREMDMRFWLEQLEAEMKEPA